MSENVAITFRGAVLALILATMSASAQSIDTNKTVAKITVLPRYNEWFLIQAEGRARLEAVIRISADERDRLIREGSARERGIGIFVAEQQGDIGLLLSLADLLEDKEPTIPYALPTASAGEYAHDDQTVGEYLSSVYLEWFGVDVDASRKTHEELFGAIRDPARLVHPWIVKLRRARNDALLTGDIKEQISALPAELRWAVLTLGYKNSLYRLEEARKQLLGLPGAIRQSIRNRHNPLETEPLFRVNGGEYGAIVLEECQAILQSSDE